MTAQNEYSATNLLAMGYRHQENATDKLIVESKNCKCGAPMMYEGWAKEGSYIALAVCPMCGEVVEF